LQVATSHLSISLTIPPTATVRDLLQKVTLETHKLIQLGVPPYTTSATDGELVALYTRDGTWCAVDDFVVGLEGMCYALTREDLGRLKPIPSPLEGLMRDETDAPTYGKDIVIDSFNVTSLIKDAPPHTPSITPTTRSLPTTSLTASLSTPKVFISYCWANSAEAALYTGQSYVGHCDPRKIAERMREAGIEAWIDADQMRGGDQLFLKIADGLKKAAVVVCCVSDEYEQSENCRLEFTYTKNRKKPCILVRVGTRESQQWLDGVIGLLAAGQLWIDMTDPHRMEERHRELLDVVRRDLATHGGGVVEGKLPQRKLPQSTGPVRSTSGRHTPPPPIQPEEIDSKTSADPSYAPSSPSYTPNSPVNTPKSPGGMKHSDSAASDIASLTQQLNNLNLKLKDLSKLTETLEDKIDNETDPSIVERLKNRLNNCYLHDANLRAERTRVGEQIGHLSHVAQLPTASTTPPESPFYMPNSPASSPCYGIPLDFSDDLELPDTSYNCGTSSAPGSTAQGASGPLPPPPPPVSNPPSPASQAEEEEGGSSKKKKKQTAPPPPPPS
ncbi:hypothetical protein HK104_000782, partial [Borealophlyctis nickersoniae]